MSTTTAVQIVEKVGELYVLNKDALSRIINHESVGDKKVAVLTVAGAFRKGKSFFLSNIVRYLECKKSGGDWMDPNAPVAGFTWRQSASAVTEGILMWPEPFIVKNESDEEIAVLLMDTEGAFDHKSSMTQCATVFALSALLSSALVFNVSQDVQEDTLNHLQFFASYGSYALDNEEGNTPFQSLLFLIRDWQNGNEFGLNAGTKHLEDILKPEATSNESMQALRRDIQRCFLDIKCALMPSPGIKICRASERGTTVNDMDPEFKVQLGELVPHLIEELLRPKEIGGNQITGPEFLEFFSMYVNIFASGVVPEPKSIFDATAEATHQSALRAGLDHYDIAMKGKFDRLTDGEYIEEVVLNESHAYLTKDAFKVFNDARKMGNLPEFLDKLNSDITKKFEEVYMIDNKNRIKLAATQKKHKNEKEELEAKIEAAKKEMEEAEKKREEEAEQARLEVARLEQQRDALQATNDDRVREVENQLQLMRAENAMREEMHKREREASDRRIEVLIAEIRALKTSSCSIQ